jgi:hypothetical protein
MKDCINYYIKLFLIMSILVSAAWSISNHMDSDPESQLRNHIEKAVDNFDEDEWVEVASDSDKTYLYRNTKYGFSIGFQERGYYETGISSLVLDSKFCCEMGWKLRHKFKKVKQTKSLDIFATKPTLENIK